MHFCNNCDNMLYIRLQDEDSDSLVYYCRNCGKLDQTVDKDNICVSKKDFVAKEKAYLHNINQYSKLDPTLPRTINIKCPNQSCPSNNGSKNEVIYLRYDDDNMQYIYICTICDKIWKTSEE
tara:strand:+ start:3463 stop:3828 length:366 start_codon:yes stop_codon:yes gene_type:complete